MRAATLFFPAQSSLYIIINFYHAFYAVTPTSHTAHIVPQLDSALYETNSQLCFMTRKKLIQRFSPRLSFNPSAKIYTTKTVCTI